MKTRRAPRRYLDCYLALLEGMCTVPTPYGPVLAPEGIAGPDWDWREDVTFDYLVPEYTRDHNTGVLVLMKYGVQLPRDGPDKLEVGIRALIRREYGKKLPPLPGQPTNWRKK